MMSHGWIDTFDGGHIVCPADFIIKGINGELYPCKPDIFKKTYFTEDEYAKNQIKKSQSSKLIDDWQMTIEEKSLIILNDLL